MPLHPAILNAVTGQPAAAAWAGIAAHLRDEFFAPVAGSGAESEVVRRDRGLTELDNVLSGSAWDLWSHFEGVVPRASRGIVEFWTGTTGGKAVLILDGLSLREAPWVLEQAQESRLQTAPLRGPWVRTARRDDAVRQEPGV